ncbi:Signal transduction diguanylate cyclase [Lacticaseibacillus thailandensis DSM 22698 = JCM 13996]|uniref:Signal transduction diguanylate cyclase n=2 Tax=Lacticaseibacillus thailandensis TaxID=381741 RepID=A0A0R2CI96_9LACO|nr:Signal transduction diguanylate cyclase [Lacticaseibacillus thailandensis DSM 22698 = JCM 13996]
MDMATGLPASGAPLNFWLWLAQLFITTVFATGFITYYQQGWHNAHEKYGQRPVVSWMIRLTMLVGAIVLGIALHMIGWRVFANTTGLMFHNLGLFTLTFTLLVEGEALWEYLVQLVAVLFVWNMHHMGYYSDPKYTISLVILAILAVIIWLHKNDIRYYVVRNVGLFTVIGLDFWTLLPRHSAGLTMTPLIAFQGFSMYLGMIIATAFYLRADHLAEVRNEENDQTAHFDSLTNAKSYATFEEEVTAAFNRARQQGQPLTMAALDIDYFKQINDHYGHLGGDDVLVGIAQQLSAVLARHGNRAALYRTGGEEFNVVLPAMDVKAAQPIVEDCWRSVRQGHFHAGDNIVRLTISMGVVDMVDADRNIEDLYRRADEGLYQSKHHGRNTITVNGRTVAGDPERRPIAIRTILTQRVYDTQSQPIVATHDEVILATYAQPYDRWDFPDDVDLPLSVQLDYVQRLLAAECCGRVIMNLTQKQFLDVQTPAYLARFQAHHPALKRLVLELGNLPSAAQIAARTRAFHEYGLRIQLEDLAPFGEDKLIRAVLPVVDGLKFNVERVRAAVEAGQVKLQVDDFRQTMARYNVVVVVNGIKTVMMLITPGRYWVRGMLKGITTTGRNCPGLPDRSG